MDVWTCEQTGGGFISLSYFVEGMLVAKDWVPVIIPVVSFATHMLWNSLTKFAFG